MVKKISGNTPTTGATAASGIKENQEVKATKVDSVGKVGQIEQQGNTGQVRQQTRPLTAEERKHLMSMVDEEAAKLFGSKKIAEAKKEVVTKSLKYTFAAGTIEEDEG